MKTFAQKIIAAGVGVFLTTSVAVYGATLYQNITTDTGNSLNFNNGVTIGNEIVLANGYPSAIVTNFSFEIYSTNASFAGASVRMQVFLYNNNGPLFNTYATPGPSIYDSGLFPLSTPLQSSLGFSDVVTLNFNSLNITVNNNFTFAAVVTGLAASDRVGMELFDPAAVGLNHEDYWVNDNGSGWVLKTNSVAAGFGALFQGTPIPEPSTLGLSVVGASLLLGSFWLRRRQDQSRQG
jgi:hypothetical protein